MRRYLVALALFGAFVSNGIGCAGEQPPVNRVGVNVVEKSLFTGSWYMSSVVIDTEHEGASMGTYPGDAATDFNGSGYTTIPRVRWVIDEDFLYAYRDYEVISGVDGAPREPGEHLGHPVAAFPIESHFDIKRAYNAVTGEEQNVIYEDTADRRWYERRFMRVDWSNNALSRYYGQIHDLYALLGIYKREASTLYVQDASAFPDNWRPQFHFMSCNGADDTSEGCTPNDRDWASDYDKDELFSFSFVTQDVLSPGMVADPYGGGTVPFCLSPYSDAPLCTTFAVYVRHSFLRVSDTRQYEALNYHEELMDQHGYFRLDQPTVDRQTSADDVYWGETDFLNYAANRHNIWKQWHDEAGNPIPYTEREVRQVVWYSSPEMPAHLMKPSFDAASEWNEVLMSMVRELRGQDVPRYADQACQTDDPDGYCFCVADPETGETVNPTCPGRYDPYEPPSEAAARLEGGEPFDCYVNVPAGAEPEGDQWRTATDESFYGWFDAAFEGSECVMIMRPNHCNVRDVAAGEADPMECQERGDIRFKLISYVDLGSTPFLGVAQLRSDPVTGEIIMGDANLGGGALESYRTSALNIYDLLNGDLSPEDIIHGEDVRSYLANIQRVNLPAPPRLDFTTALHLGTAATGDLAALNDRMDHAMVRANQLRGPEAHSKIFSHRREALIGTDLERRLTANLDTLSLAGMRSIPTRAAEDLSNIPEEILEVASPFRNDGVSMLVDSFESQTLEYARRNVLMPNEYTDHGAMHYVQKRMDWPRPRVDFNLNRVLYGNAQAHELGHCMGLRHDFGGNADRDNYFEDYWSIDERFPLPNPSSFDTDGTPGLSDEEQRTFTEEYEETRRLRELAGLDETMNSSIMEYTGNFYARARTRIGYYDHAAIRFAYGNLDVVGDNVAGLPAEEVNTWNTNRTSLAYYHGGEVCGTDADCPYSASGTHAGMLLPANTDAGLTQRCVPNPRDASFGGVCSNLSDDIAEVAAGDPAPRYTPVEFRYCTDERTSRGQAPGTIGWCNLFDEGDSYREIVRNFMEAYERAYIFGAFRRYRSGWGWQDYILNTFYRYTGPLMNIFQNMVYEYHRNSEFRTDTEPFGFYDQFLASADIVNFYARILGSPNVGAYRWDNAWQRYVRNNVDPDVPGAQISMPVGLARYFYSDYQSGLSGITRLERAGSYFEKIFTIFFLTSRGYQAAYGIEEPFLVNFYDVFPVEMQTIFSGLIREAPESLAPRLFCPGGTFPACAEPELQYMDFYRGDCREGSTTCRPDPIEVTYRDLPVVDGGSNILLQIYGLVYSLLDFPAFFDTSYAQQIAVCVEGAADCFSPSDTAVEGDDFVRYESDRYGKAFMAWQVEPTRDIPNATSIGFAMVKEAKDMQFIYNSLRKYRGDVDICGPGCTPLSTANLTAAELAELDAIGYTLPSDSGTVGNEVSRTYRRLTDLESFFNQLIQIRRDVGL